MDIPLGLVSLAALAIAIIIGCIRTRTNTGILSLSLAFAIGLLLANLKPKEVGAAFPSELFLMLVGITYLFSMAQQNGTLDKLTKHLISLVRGNPALLPIFFFLMAFALSALGPGNIAATALIAPVGMVIAVRAGVNPLLMAIMICTGANAGAFSPVSPTGIIGMGLAEKIGIDDPAVPMQVFLISAFIQTLSAIAAYLIFKGHANRDNSQLRAFLDKQKSERFNRNNIITIVTIAALITAVAVFRVPISLGAFIAVAILSLLEVSDNEESIRSMPWSAIILVTGVTVLIGLVERTGGLDLATSALATLSGIGTINAALAFITGLVSAYSSSSGVVMPAFIPLIPGLIAKLGGGDALKMLISVCVGSHMVDVSPLSTLGAIVIASYHDKHKRPVLYRNLLIWGMSMAVVGAVLSYVFLDLL